MDLNTIMDMGIYCTNLNGLIDFALMSTTVSAEECMGAVNGRRIQEPDKDAGLGVKFHEPVAGSRKRAEGLEVKWKLHDWVFRTERSCRVTVSSTAVDSMLLPFCHDVTQKTFRVASDDKAKTTHPCSATGIATCEILVPESLLADYVTLYSKILGSKFEITGDDATDRSCSLDVGVPQGAGTAKVILRGAQRRK